MGQVKSINLFIDLIIILADETNLFNFLVKGIIIQINRLYVNLWLFYEKSKNIY